MTDVSQTTTEGETLPATNDRSIDPLQRAAADGETISVPVDLGGFLGENVFCSLTSDWTPQHNDASYADLGSIANTAVVSGLHTAAQLTHSLRGAGIFDDRAGAERFLDTRLHRLRWVAPVLVGATPDWSVTITGTHAADGHTLVSTRHAVTSGDVTHMVAEHTGVIVSTDALPVGPRVSGSQRLAASRDRGEAFATDPDRLYDDLGYLESLTQLDGPRYVGATSWITVDQREADVFAEVSGGRVPWHNDPRFCAESLLSGRPVVHRMHLVAFCSWAAQCCGLIRGANVAWSSRQERDRPRTGTAMAYGLDDVEWTDDVPVDAPFRIHVTLEDLVQRAPGRYVGSFRQEFEVRGAPFVALSLTFKAMLFSEQP